MPVVADHCIRSAAALVRLAALGLAVAAGAVASRGETNALEVGRQAVSPAEFRWFMEQERAGVFRHFRARFHVEADTDFWGKRIGETTPRAVLQSNTVTRVVREKCEQDLFLELGLLPDTSYAAFLASLEQTNQERAEAAKEGKAVYGPVRYTQLQFYEHRKAMLRAKAMEMLAAKRWPPKEEDLKDYFAQHRSLFRTQPSYTLEVVTVRKGEKPAANSSTNAVLAAAERIQSRLRDGATVPVALAAEANGASITASSRRMEDVSADRLGELFPEVQQFKRVAALAPGQTALLADAGTQVRVVRCIAKSTGTERAYSEVREQVRQRWIEQRYERQLQQLVRQARVKINQEIIDSLLP